MHLHLKATVNTFSCLALDWALNSSAAQQHVQKQYSSWLKTCLFLQIFDNMNRKSRLLSDAFAFLSLVVYLHLVTGMNVDVIIILCGGMKSTQPAVLLLKQRKGFWITLMDVKEVHTSDRTMENVYKGEIFVYGSCFICETITITPS